MTGFNGLPVAAAEESGVQWMGVSKILGPSWAQLPVLTVGLLGVQMMWSVEMAYGASERCVIIFAVDSNLDTQ